MSISSIKFFDQLRKLDQFGADIHISQFEKSKHQTYMGSFCTLITYPFMILMSFYMLFLYDSTAQDIIY